MPTPAEVRKVVESVVGTEGDETVLEYVVSILEDGEFEFGTDGEEAFEAFGAVLVGCCFAEVGQAVTEVILAFLAPCPVCASHQLYDCLRAGERWPLQHR